MTREALLDPALRRVWLTSIPLVLFILVAVLGPIIVPYDATTTHLTERLLPPGSALSSGGTAWFGTDQVGRDLLPQLIQGARVSLIVGVATVAVAGVVGSAIGVTAGYLGGFADTVAMRIADIQLAFPAFLLAILIASVLGPSIPNVVVTLAVTRWVIFARVARASALTVREREYVDAARLIGSSRFRVMWKHILPAATTPLTVIATVHLALVILAEASLSFLGLGTPPSTPSWGLTVANGRDYLATAWWISTIPGVALALVMVSVGQFGDAIRDHFDPTLRLG